MAQAFYPDLRDVVKPDAVFGPDGEQQTGPLDPCPVCDSHPHEAPEGVHDHISAIKHGANPGDPKWNFPHCWKCGFRPGVNEAVNQRVMAQAWQQFQEMYTQHLKDLQNKDKGVDPETKGELYRLATENEQLKAQLEGRPANTLSTDKEDTSGA